MNELIPIKVARIDGTEINTVNARDLHCFLENKDKYTTWIKDRIEQFGFVENKDFVTFSENSEKIGKGRPRKEYVGAISEGTRNGRAQRQGQGSTPLLHR